MLRIVVLIWHLPNERSVQCVFFILSLQKSVHTPVTAQHVAWLFRFIDHASCVNRLAERLPWKWSGVTHSRRKISILASLQSQKAKQKFVMQPKWDNLSKYGQCNRFSKTRFFQKVAGFASNRASRFAKVRRKQWCLADPWELTWSYSRFWGRKWIPPTVKEKNKPTGKAGALEGVNMAVR